MTHSTIIYTHTDEAPALATYSLLPVVRAYRDQGGVEVETRDISLAGRHPRHLPRAPRAEQRIADALAELGVLGADPEANIIKLPNVSASMPQLKAAIAELQGQGLRRARLPRGPEDRRGPRRPRPLRARSSAARSTRCCARATPTVVRRPRSRDYARTHPHRMGAWTSDSKTNVGPHDGDDFCSTEQSAVSPRPDRCGSSWSTPTARRPCCAARSRSSPGEVVDAAVLRVGPTCARSSPTRSPGPRPRACCSPCTSRPR